MRLYFKKTETEIDKIIKFLTELGFTWPVSGHRKSAHYYLAWNGRMLVVNVRDLMVAKRIIEEAILWKK